MSDLVSYELSDRIATLRMDDGKVNAVSLAMSESIGAALDRAEADEAVVILTGRDGVFSAGFDMSVFDKEPDDVVAMIRAGAELAERVMSFPNPVVTACSGHAIAMGAFLMMSGDVRIAAAGPFKIGMNEVAIGMTVPHFALAVARHRLSPAHFNLAAITGRFYTPEEAVEAGFVDRVVGKDSLEDEARAVATALGAIDRRAHAATKLRVRAGALAELREGIETELSVEGLRAQAG